MPTTTPIRTVPRPSLGAGECAPQQNVGAVPHSMSDDEREAAIKLAGEMVERHMDRYAESGCFSDRGNADRARLAMEALIRGRSAAQVAKLEAELGLA